MSAKTERYHLDSELTLHDRTHSPLTVRAVSLSLIKQDDEVIECRLTFQVSPQLYQRIETEALFNLKPEVRRPLTGGNFLPSPDIEIEIGLQPNLLPQPIERAVDANEAATYILNLNQEQPDNPLLSTESWLALSVKQQQESGETGYRTLWADITASAFVQSATSGSSDQMNNALANFFKESIEANLPAVTQEATSQIVEEMTNYFKQVADTSLDGLTKSVPSILQEALEAGLKSTPTEGQFFEEIVNFFEEDDWPFVQIEGEPLLQMVFQGENGKWTCYAKARDDQEQFVFYSICPVNAPENKRLAVAEFLTRANSGMIIGNFEMDFEDGEIRYKTSIDVEGDRLSFALIKRLVYANVTMMDEYLPGIMSVIYGEAEAGEAIAKIET
ncbi:YbjN domain-containing protein [Floridanema evergladense]|uniref:YbjN domain-containing protein n=1 Tax=Floridaenema evergladense BLCC-F167 TaxID=3153639 RepID=A0ABV4WKQ8_9CYAN